MLGRGGSDGYIMDASVKLHCGTCEFWGGPRRVLEDSKTLTITALGWCNNPASPNYQKMTSPEHGPMDTCGNGGSDRKFRINGQNLSHRWNHRTIEEVANGSCT